MEAARIIGEPIQREPGVPRGELCGVAGAQWAGFATLDGRLGGACAHRSSESHGCRGATRGASESISLAYRRRSGVASAGITDLRPVVVARSRVVESRPAGWQ